MKIHQIFSTLYVIFAATTLLHVQVEGKSTYAKSFPNGEALAKKKGIFHVKGNGKGAPADWAKQWSISKQPWAELCSQPFPSPTNSKKKAIRYLRGGKSKKKNNAKKEIKMDKNKGKKNETKQKKSKEPSTVSNKDKKKKNVQATFGEAFGDPCCVWREGDPNPKKMGKFNKDGSIKKPIKMDKSQCDALSNNKDGSTQSDKGISDGTDEGSPRDENGGDLQSEGEEKIDDGGEENSKGGE